MKPVKLTFNGINSFSERTVIDFEALAQNGLFGIFGDTGSGKSTILDCINFALYGNVERSKEKTDIINYRCDKAEVEFVFDILTEGKRKRYTVQRVVKRDKSGTHKATLYEDDGDKELCIADKASSVEKKIVEILGVTAEDFRKCIALPQGEFSEFVKSAPRERLALIERLFSLSRYGERLKEKINNRQNAIESQYQNFSGKLSAYDSVSDEVLDEARKILEANKKELESITPVADACAKNCQRLRALKEKRDELENIKAELAATEEKRTQMEELRQMLVALPACREVKQVAAVAEEMRRAIEKYNTEIVAVKERLTTCEKRIAELEKAIKEGNHEDKIQELLKRSAQFKTIAGKPERLKIILKELEAKRGEYRSAEDRVQTLRAQKLRAEEEFKSAEEDFKSKSGVDLEQLVGVKFKGAVLRGEYVSTLEYLAALYGNVKSFKEDSPLYNYVSAELKAKIKEYEIRISDVKDFGGEAAGQLEELRRIDNERSAAQNVLNQKKDALQKLKIAEETLAVELKTIKVDGEKLRERADELAAEIKGVFGGSAEEFEIQFKQNEDELARLTAQKRELSEKLEAAKQAKNELDISAEKFKILLQSAKADCAEAENRLKALLSSGGFENVESCIKIIDKFSCFQNAEQAVAEFDGKVLSLNARRKEIEKNAEIFKFSEKELSDAEIKKSELENIVLEISAKVAVSNENCRSIKCRLDEKKEISKDFEAVEHERTLIAKLKEVTKNNKFLEYIANEYLEDISALASSTLIKLTDGRYFLTYKDNNFFVGDNFNCGALRGVNTLSGGETFLVSLSLALALSQTICAKSMKSIEFFFLDEGFGTLDSTLVDTVMGALEKLKNSHFTIGVISHVEELKHRIGCKITVKKATETHGSTVSFSL